MKLEELIQDPQLEEDIKKRAATAAAAGLISLGLGSTGFMYDKYMKGPETQRYNIEKQISYDDSEKLKPEISKKTTAVIPSKKPEITRQPEITKQPSTIIPTKKPEIAKVDQIPDSIKNISNPNGIILRNAAIRAGLRGAELVQFISQTAHESNNFQNMIEKAPSKSNEVKYFSKKYDIKYNPTLAKTLGNDKPGDGYKYRGRGFIQLTGKYNYEKAKNDLNLKGKDDIVKYPDRAADPKIAASIAVWYWFDRVKPNVTDFKNIYVSTAPINPGLKGIEDRKSKFSYYSK